MGSVTGSTVSLSNLQCRKCFKAFEDKHGLAVHQLKAGHLACDLCGDTFHSIESVSAHRTEIHKRPVSIMCPGCTKAFVTGGGWMQHVEKGECPSLFAKDIAGNTAQFMQQLNKEWGQRAKVEDASKVFSGDSHITDTWDGWKEEVDTPRFDNPDDFPGIATQGSQLSSQSGNVWSQKKNLFPDSQGRKVVVVPSTQTENLAQPTSSGQSSGGRVLDPDMPGFNVGIFYNPILEIFTCPHKCNTKCKTAQAMISHLKSPKHTAVEFSCPGCRGKFTTTGSWIQHAETVALSKCRIRYASNFSRIMREVSNGALDVQSIDQMFQEETKVKLSDSWGTPIQASSAQPIPGSNQWTESKQAEASGSKSNSSGTQASASWSGLAGK